MFALSGIRQNIIKKIHENAYAAYPRPSDTKTRDPKSTYRTEHRCTLSTVFDGTEKPRNTVLNVYSGSIEPVCQLTGLTDPPKFHNSQI